MFSDSSSPILPIRGFPSNGHTDGDSQERHGQNVQRPNTNELQPRTIEDVREQVAQSIAVRLTRKFKAVDSTRVAVQFTLSRNDDDDFLRRIAEHVEHSVALSTGPGKDWLIAVAATRSGSSAPSGSSQAHRSQKKPEKQLPPLPDQAAVLISGSSHSTVQRASILTQSKFFTRVVTSSFSYAGTTRWSATISSLGSSPTSPDELALWDVLVQSARSPLDPAVPPPEAMSVDEMLATARARLERLTPETAWSELSEGSLPMPAILVDIRPESQRRKEGFIRGALPIERGALEWRLDPRSRSEARLSIANRYDLRVVVMSQDGNASSLAAAMLLDLGLLYSTDVIGGFRAWKEAGLPKEVEEPPSEASEIYPY